MRRKAAAASVSATVAAVEAATLWVPPTLSLSHCTTSLKERFYYVLTRAKVLF